jgi:SCY1-like protein 2
MGNTLLRDYNVEKESFLTGGFQNLWKIYKGKHKDRNTDVSVFFFDKKSLDKFNKDQRDEVINILKKEATSLAKYKHPGLLGIVELPLEDKTSLAFVTEPIHYTLTSFAETIMYL